MSTFDLVAVLKTACRSAGTMLPPLNPLINSWNEHEAVELSRRVSVFAQAFMFEVEGNEKRCEAIKTDLESARQLFQLFERATEPAKREPSTRKLEMLARAAANAIAAQEHVPHDDKLDVLEARDTLTETDLITFEAFHAGQTLRVEAFVGGGRWVSEKSSDELSPRSENWSHED